MPAEGFRGNVVRVHEMTVKAAPAGNPVLVCTVQFADELGNVHAVCNHNFVLDEESIGDDGLTAAAKELFRVLVRRVETIHFRQPSDGPAEVLTGIAETLRSNAEQASDEPGTQG